MGAERVDTGMLPVLPTYVTLPVIDAFSDSKYVTVFADGSYVRDWRPMD